MKVCIVGAGAIGGLIGTRLAAAGQAQVSALARGATLQSLQQQGWRLQSAGGVVQAPVQASEHAEALGPQDLVIIAVKGPALAAVAAQLRPLMGQQTVVLPAMNGVPWWFCAGLPDTRLHRLDSLDPAGTIAASIPFSAVLGCVVHASASTPEPGLVHHHMGQGLIIGEPQGGPSERVAEVTQLLAHAGFDAKASDDVRFDIWYKLWGNMTMNPVSAITGATSDLVLADPQVRAFCSAAMDEAARIGALLGVPITQSAEDRHAVTQRLGAFKTSMLQDVQADRPIELDAIVTAVHEIGARLGVPTPHIDALLGLTRLFARVRGLYPNT